MKPRYRPLDAFLIAHLWGEAGVSLDGHPIHARAANSRTTALPRVPVAPVTRQFMASFLKEFQD